MTPSIVKNVVRMPKQCAKQLRTRISYMSSEQLGRLLQAAKEYDPREHAMFLFAVAHGARAQEICKLRRSDINFHNEQVHIARLKGSLPRLRPAEGQGQRSVRREGLAEGVAGRPTDRPGQLRVQLTEVKPDEPRPLHYRCRE
jgi:integrase